MEQNGDVTTTTDEGGLRNRRKRRRSSETVSLESMEEYIPTPPDGGWGWVIVIASAVGNLIVDGIGYGFGVFLVPLVAAFDAPKSYVSMVGSLLCGTYLSTGPIVSALTNKFGCRAIVIAGSLIATAAFIIASQSTSIFMLIFTYGFLGGIGLGMMYLPCIVSVGYYFEKRRAFATGLAVCGSGVGTFVFPQLSEYLLSELNWSGVFLIHAGIIFNGCICGALMRPLEVKKRPKVKDKDAEMAKDEITMLDRVKENTKKNRSVSECAHNRKAGGDGRVKENGSEPGSLPNVAFVKSSETGQPKLSISSAPGNSQMVTEGETSTETSPEHSNYCTPASTNPNTPLKEIHEHEPLTDTQNDDTSHSADQIDQSNEMSMTDTINGFIHSSPAITTVDGPSTTRQNSSNSEFSPLLEVPDPMGHNKKRDSTDTRRNPVGSRSNMSHLSSMRSLHVSKKDLARPLYRKDIFYSGSVLNIPQFQSQPDMKSYITSIISIPGEADFVDGGPSGSSKCVNNCCSFLPRPMRDVLGAMIDLSLLKDVSFMLICFGNILTFLGFFIPFMFLVDRAIELGISQNKAAFLISIIGISNTVGRVAVGKLADFKFMDSLVITYVSIFLCGAVTALVPFCKSYALLALNAALFGLGVAAFVSLSSIIICDRLGLDKLTNGFGLLSMVRGVGSMAGPPLAGAMYDATGSYNLSFFLGGLLMFAGAGCHVLLHLPCLRPKHTMVVPPPDADLQVAEIVELGTTMGSKPQVISLDDSTLHSL